MSLPVYAGMWVDVEALAGECIDITEYLNAQNLLNLLANNDKCYDAMVREFYANCRANKQKSVLRSVVRNVHMELSAEVLCSEFGLVDSGYTVDYKRISAKNVDKVAVKGYNDLEFLGEIRQNGDRVMNTGKKTKFYAPYMKVLPRLLHLIITHNILPKAGSITSVSALERVILWHMLHKQPVNIGNLIIATMLNRIRKIKSRENKRTHLPFGMLLTRLFRRFNVPFLADHVDKGFYAQKMGVSYFKKLAFKAEDGGWMWKKSYTSDAVIGQTGDANRKVEEIKEMDKGGKCAGVEVRPVVGEKAHLEDVVILSEQTRKGASVCDNVILLLFVSSSRWQHRSITQYLYD